MSKIAEPLLARALLCRHIAESSWNQEMAGKLERLAADCTRVAATAEAETVPDGQIY